MERCSAVITAVGSWFPKDVLTNEELSQMVDTSDEWIMTRIGVKQRPILRGDHLGVSHMGIKAVREIIEKRHLDPQEIDAIVFSTTTADYKFPSSASIVAHAFGIHNALTFDLSAACCGFLYGLDTATSLVASGRYKKVILIGADKMSSMVDYTDRSTSPIFGDGAGAVLIEPSDSDNGIQDVIMRVNGVGLEHLQMKAGGSVCPASVETLNNKEHFIHQDGQMVFKAAVASMADVCVEIMKRNNLSKEDISWFVPHQANMRIIEAVARRMGVSKDRVMVNIQNNANTSSATLPLCLSQWEQQMKKGDNIILTAFGAGYTWGAVYLKWGYDH